MKNVMHSFFL